MKIEQVLSKAGIQKSDIEKVKWNFHLISELQALLKIPEYVLSRFFIKVISLHQFPCGNIHKSPSLYVYFTSVSNIIYEFFFLFLQHKELDHLSYKKVGRSTFVGDLASSFELFHKFLNKFSLAFKCISATHTHTHTHICSNI